VGAFRALARRALLAGAGALAARVTLGAVSRSSRATQLERLNHRGQTVTLASGPAMAVAAATTAALGAAAWRSTTTDPAGSPRPLGLPIAAAAAVAGLGSGAVGLYDDVVGSRPEQKSAKGFRGHLAALRRGQITTGLVKIVGIGASGALAAAALASRPRPGQRGGLAATVTDVVIDTGLIAGSANLINLLDLRPGRALKAGLAVGVPLTLGPAGALAAGPVGAAAGLLPDDLGERTMLGDAGANAFGALLGLATAATLPRPARLAVLAGIVGLTLASEKVSFTAVIESHPVLRRLDEWGRVRR